MGTATDTATHWWNLDDGTGITAADQTAGLDATLNGAASWTADNTRGKALDLTGTTGYAETAGPALDTSKSYTVSAWVKLTSTAANSTFLFPIQRQQQHQRIPRSTTPRALTSIFRDGLPAESADHFPFRGSWLAG